METGFKTLTRLQLETELHIATKQKTVPAKATKQTTLNAVASSSKAPAAPATTANRDTKGEAKTLKARTKSLFDQYVSRQDRAIDHALILSNI